CSLDLIIPERLRARHWAGYRQTMATGHTSYGDRLLEVPALHRDGRTLSIAFTVSMMHDADGCTPTALASVLRDDSERLPSRRRAHPLDRVHGVADARCRRRYPYCDRGRPARRHRTLARAATVACRAHRPSGRR